MKYKVSILILIEYMIINIINIIKYGITINNGI